MVNFAILADVGQIQANTIPWPMEISGKQVRVGRHWTLIGSHIESGVLSPSHHGYLPLGMLSFLDWTEE